MEMLRRLKSSPGYAEGDPEARATYDRIYYQATLRSPELLDRLIEYLQMNWTLQEILKAGAIGDQLWRET